MKGLVSRRRHIRPLVLLVLAAAATPAFAQTPAPEGGEPAVRYTMQPVDGGVMKLDTRSGRMSFCSARTGSWACELVPEERTAYEDEITRLNDRIAAQQKGTTAPRADNVPPGVPDIAGPASPAPPSASVQPKAGEGAGSTAEAPDAGAPTDEGAVRRHIDQAMDTAEYVFRRFMDMVARMKGEEERL